MYVLSTQPSQVGSLFTFLARQGAKYRAGIRVDEHVYDQVIDHYHDDVSYHYYCLQVLNYITHADEDFVNEEREQVHYIYSKQIYVSLMHILSQ